MGCIKSVREVKNRHLDNFESSNPEIQIYLFRTMIFFTEVLYFMYIEKYTLYLFTYILIYFLHFICP